MPVPFLCLCCLLLQDPGVAVQRPCVHLELCGAGGWVGGLAAVRAQRRAAGDAFSLLCPTDRRAGSEPLLLHCRCRRLLQSLVKSFEATDLPGQHNSSGRGLLVPHRGSSGSRSDDALQGSILGQGQLVAAIRTCPCPLLPAMCSTTTFLRLCLRCCSAHRQVCAPQAVGGVRRGRHVCAGVQLQHHGQGEAV